MTHFTPFSAALGGAFIGASASLLLLLNGKVAGISGIFGGLLNPRSSERSWRALFLAGLLGSGLLFAWLRPGAIGSAPALSLGSVLLAGLLVGSGTALGGGCTSGHGVCGIARGSTRSVLATLTFMATGFATVYVLRHALGGAP